EADVYWERQPRVSQLAAWVSRQSAPLGQRGQLWARWRNARHRFRSKSIPRSKNWLGYRLVADRIEFWTRREQRMQQRELFELTPTAGSPGFFNRDGAECARW